MSITTKHMTARGGVRPLLGFLAACALALAALTAAAPARAAELAYTIYPTPHTVTAGEGGQVLRDTATTVVEPGIDSYTVDRMNEALALKGITGTAADEIPTADDQNSVLVGVYGSGDAVDAYVADEVEAGDISYTEGLFDKTDAYLLVTRAATDAHPDQIIVLGKSTDAAYYGLTTVYQVFQQMSAATLQDMQIEDYADVVTRGFIEGYYGNPWSTQNRVDLMTWGGYYKLNAYFYAPKDDPKHNAKWRELYTDEELEQKIEPLAQAGNESKCRFVFALHPFMSNPITSGNYNDSVPILKQKFQQVLDHGVRQIAILADDAGNVDSALCTRLLEDMTEWLHEKQAEKNDDGTLKYEGLKDTIIFCPENYMGSGEGWYANLPSNVQVINTGGRVWGKVTPDFVSTFKNNSGNHAPFMWINWPCSDNTHDSLSMGGYENALGLGVTPGSVDGIVLNPMQQSEPSKAGIFMNADYSWHMWTDSYDHADQVWEDAFSYVDNNSPNATAASDALRELSRNMKRYLGGGQVFESRESAHIKDQLTSFQGKVTAGTVTADDIDAMRPIFEELQDASATYRASAGNTALRDQIEPWLSTWDDVTAAALADLDALEAALAGDTSTMLTKQAEGSEALAASKTNGFLYVDYTEYAAVGKAYIMPMLEALDADLANRATVATDPNAFVTTYISDVFTNPYSGKLANIIDGDLSTSAVFHEPNYLNEGNYIGLTFSKATDVDSVRFAMGSGKNHMYHGKLQVTHNGTDWEDVADQTFSQGSSTSAFTYEATGLGLKDVTGVRIIATQDNGADLWLNIYDISINSVSTEEEPEAVPGEVSIENQVRADSNPLANVNDGDPSTYAWFCKSTDPKSDTTAEGAAVVLTFDSAQTINTISFKQDTTDCISSGTAQYQDESGNWHDVGTVTNAAEQTFTFGDVTAQAVRIVNGAETARWWKVYELAAYQGESVIPTPTVTMSDGMSIYEGNLANTVDGSDSTLVWLKGSTNNNIRNNDAVTFTYASPITVGTVRLVQGGADVISGALEYTTDGTTWVKAGDVAATQTQDITFGNVEGVTGLRVRSTSDQGRWWKLCEMTPAAVEPNAGPDVITNADGVGVTTSEAEGSASIDSGSVELAEGKYVAVDLGCVRDGVTVDAGSSTLDSTELVYSQNGLEWVAFPQDGNVQARYVGVRATAATTAAFNGFTASYATKSEPSFVSSTGNLGTFDASAIFDGSLSTAFKNTSGPAQGDTVVFDLGQERTINSIAYYVPETSKDFIRNAVIEVADSPDAATWTPVLKINGDTSATDFADSTTAKTAAWLTHDSKNPGNMYTANPKTADTQGNESDPNGTSELNVSARYLRIRFTTGYSQRWIEIGEIVINGGAYVSPYGDADFVSTVTEEQGKLPTNLVDADLSTAWQPSEDAGTLTYHVSAPRNAQGDAYQGVRIVSSGKASGAKVSAVVYTDGTYTSTETVDLGSLDQPVTDFTFKGKTVKDIVISWDGVKPALAEIYLLDSADDNVSKDELQAAVDAAKLVDSSAWTASTKTALATALKTAEDALKNDNVTQSYIDAVTAALTSATSAGTERYTDELPEKLENDGTYTAATYQAYADAYSALQAALEDKDDLAKGRGDALAQAVSDAADALAYDQTEYQRAELAVTDAQRFVTAAGATTPYTTDSYDAFTTALGALQELLDTQDAATAVKPSKFAAARKDLVNAEGGLVDASALIAARGEFEATVAGNYTADSYDAYKKAYDDSAAALKKGTADEVAAAAQALADAAAKLAAVDLDGIVEEVGKLSADDYTADSWAALQAAVDAAQNAGADASKRDLAQAIADARAALVNVRALKGAVAKAEGVDRALYTADSLAALDQAVAAAKALYANGTASQAADALAAVQAAFNGLTLTEPQVTTHTVTFDDRFGTKTAVEVENGQVVPAGSIPADPTATGWVFKGWCLYVNGTYLAFDLSAPITQDVVLYANWERSGSGQTGQEGQKPQEPQDPGETGKKPAGKTDAGMPQTGDTALLGVGIALAVAVVAIVAGVVLKRRGGK